MKWDPSRHSPSRAHLALWQSEAIWERNVRVAHAQLMTILAARNEERDGVLWSGGDLDVYDRWASIQNHKTLAAYNQRIDQLYANHRVEMTHIQSNIHLDESRHTHADCFDQEQYDSDEDPLCDSNK